MIAVNIKRGQGYKTFVPYLRMVSCPVGGCNRGLAVVDLKPYSKATVEYKCCDHNYQVMETVGEGTQAYIHMEEGMAFDLTCVRTTVGSKVVGYFDSIIDKETE